MVLTALPQELDLSDTVSFWLWSNSIFRFFRSVQDLYWSLYGFTEIDVLKLPGKHSVAEGVGTFLYVCYLVVAVVVLLNALIGMLSNTYNIVEVQTLISRLWVCSFRRDRDSHP